MRRKEIPIVRPALIGRTTDYRDGNKKALEAVESVQGRGGESVTLMPVWRNW